jgi:hypothetical protein
MMLPVPDPSNRVQRFQHGSVGLVTGAGLGFGAKKRHCNFVFPSLYEEGSVPCHMPLNFGNSYIQLTHVQNLKQCIDWQALDLHEEESLKDTTIKFR